MIGRGSKRRNRRWLKRYCFFCFFLIVVELFSFDPLLTTGYWPSYNVPFHQNIYTLSGYGQMWKAYGDDFSYDLCPRAKIFRRDQANVRDLDSLKYIMRFNGGRLFRI